MAKNGPIINDMIDAWSRTSGDGVCIFQNELLGLLKKEGLSRVEILNTRCVGVERHNREGMGLLPSNVKDSQPLAILLRFRRALAKASVTVFHLHAFV